MIAPVGELSYKGERIVVNERRVGAVTQRLYDAITAIQYARVPDTHAWMVPIGS